MTDGIEVTTGARQCSKLRLLLARVHQWLEFYVIFVLIQGPLGQGVANAVGLALAEAHLAARFNKPDAVVVDHHT